MNLRYSRVLLVAIALLGAGCGRRAEPPEIATPPDSTRGDTTAATTEPALEDGSLPHGRLVPVASLASLAGAGVAPWLRQWTRIEPAFPRDSVWLDSARAFSPVMVQQLRQVEADIPTIRQAAIWSADSSRYLNPDRYVEDAIRLKDRIEVMRDVDSAPLVGDVARGTLTTLAQCGPGCQFYDGWWIDRNRCVVAGRTTLYEGEQAVAARGTLDLYDLGRGTVRAIVTRRFGRAVLDRLGALSDSVSWVRFSRAPARGSRPMP